MAFGPQRFSRRVPESRRRQKRFHKGVLSQHVANVIVTVSKRQPLLELAIGGRLNRIRAYIVAECQLVGDLRMSVRTYMHLVRATPIAVFAEIESPRGAGKVAFKHSPRARYPSASIAALKELIVPVWSSTMRMSMMGFAQSPEIDVLPM